MAAPAVEAHWHTQVLTTYIQDSSFPAMQSVRIICWVKFYSEILGSMLEQSIVIFFLFFWSINKNLILFIGYCWGQMCLLQRH